MNNLQLPLFILLYFASLLILVLTGLILNRLIIEISKPKHTLDELLAMLEFYTKMTLDEFINRLKMSEIKRINNERHKEIYSGLVLETLKCCKPRMIKDLKKYMTSDAISLYIFTISHDKIDDAIMMINGKIND